METKDLIMYGAIIYLFFMLKKKQNCKCNVLDIAKYPVAPGGASIVPILPLIPVKDCVNCDLTMGINNIMNLPIFTTVNKQVEPTPASILSPEQLAVYNSASIKGIKNKYIC